MADKKANVVVKKTAERKKQRKHFVPNREAYNRINHLYQAAHLLLMENPANIELSRFYTSTAKRIAEKLVLKIDHKVKRTICKCCHILLIPGITAKHRIRGKREKHMIVTCMTCKTIKRWKTNNKDFENRLNPEKLDSKIETLNKIPDSSEIETNSVQKEIIL